MGIFTKKRKDASPQISHQESSANSSSSSHEHQPATPEAYLYAPNSLSTGFKVISGRKRRDSNMSMFSAKTAAPGLESSGSNTGAFKVHQQSSTVNRSVDALPLAHSASPSLSSSTGPSSNRHRASPLARPPSPSARSVKSVRSFFKITTKPLKPTSNKPANAPTDNTTDAGDFNLRSFRPASSNQTLPSMPTPPQPRTSSHSLRPALDVLPTPRPAFAAQHTRSSSSNSLPPNATASSPSHRSQSPSQSSISVSQFNQAKAMRSGAASLKTSSSVSSFNQLLQNTTAANADDQSNRPLSPSPSAQKRSSLGPPLSRPSSRLDLPLPTPSRVAPSRPLPKRRSSAIEPGLEYYSEYFGSPSATPALETSGTKDALFGSATPADMPSDPSNRRLSASPMPDSAALPLQSTMPSRPQSMAEDDDEKPLRPPILPHSNNSNRRTLSGTSLMNAASEWGSSLVNYLTTPEEEAKQEAKARLERSKSKAVGRSAWGNDSESEDEQEQEEDTSDSDGGLQLNVKKPSAPATPARSHNERSPTASAWDSDEAVIRREEARKQALLAQTSDSPFIRSSFSPPTPISSPKSAATPLSDSSHSKPPPSALASSQAPRPHSTFFNQAHVAPPQLAPMQLDESNLEVLNETNKLNGSAVDDDDDEAPLASIAARSSHHRAQSDLCKPSGSRMSFMSTRTGSPGTYGGQASSPLPLNHPRPSSTIDLKQPGLSPGQMRGKPSLSALIDAYGKQDPAMPFNLIPPTLGGTPRKAASQLSTSSRRSLSADNLPTAHSFRSSSSLSSRGPDTPRDSLSVHERMLSRHKQEASKYGASLVQVDKPSGQLPSPTLAKAQSHSVLPPMGAHHGMGQPLAFGPAVATDQPPPGIDPQLWATLAPDQRLNLSMRNNAMLQAQMQQMAAMQVQMQMAMQQAQMSGGSALGMPSSGGSMMGMPMAPQFWGSASALGQPQAPGSMMGRSSYIQPLGGSHSFINSR